MGVIVGSGMQAQIDQLEAKGAFSLADTFRQANQVSLESLAFMTNVPPEYEALVANSFASQAIRAQRDEKTKEDEQEKKSAVELAAEYQRELDENMLSLNIDGEDIQISQGDLRKAMQKRVEELEEQKKELEKNGGSPEQISKVEGLIGDYNSATTDSENKPLDPKAVQHLIEEDPTWAEELKNKPPASQSAENVVSGNRRSSFSDDAFNGDGIAAAPLKPVFANSASPNPPPTAPIPAPTLEKQQQNLNNALQSAGL